MPKYETPVESTGIIMISLPTTPIDDITSQQDQFQTPPEGHNMNSCPEEQRIDDCEGGDDGDRSVNGEEMFKDCDLGFSQSQTPTENLEINVRAPVILKSGDTLSVNDKLVDMANDCDLAGETLSVDDKLVDWGNDCDLAGETLSVDDASLQGEKMVDLVDDCNLGQTKDPTADLVDGGDSLSIDDDRSEGDKMGDLDKDTEDQGLSDIQITERPTTVVDRDIVETVALHDCEKTVDLGKDLDPGSSIGKLSGRMSTMELQGIVVEKNVESQELEEESEEGIIRIVEDSLSEGVTLVSDNAPTETIKPDLQEITDEKKVELQESSNGKDDEIEESKESFMKNAKDSLSEGFNLVADNGPAKFIESELHVNSAKNLDVNDPTNVIESELQVNTARDLDVNDPKVIEAELARNLDVNDPIEALVSGLQVDTAKNLEGTDKGLSSGVNLQKRGRELPASILGGRDNVKEVEIPTGFLLNVMKSVAEKSAPKDNDDRDDMVVTAMKRGVSFPRPRWWPPGYRPNWWPEGYDGED